MRIMSIFILALAFILPATAEPSANSSTKPISDPQVLVKSISDDVLAKILANKAKLSEGPAFLSALIERKMLPIIDQNRMAKMALGKPWKTISDQQKSDFIEGFKSLLINTYSGAFKAYTGQEVTFDDTKYNKKGNRAIVRSAIHVAGGTPVRLQYRLYLTKSGQWLVYDANIAGLGLFGVAVALGAQDLFKNLISGILVLVEKRFKIGDWISVDGVIEGTVEKIGFRSTSIRKFDKSLAIIPNFQFAENAVTNVSETSNWRIRWTITLQYNTTVDQLKKIRDDIEAYINKSEDFNQSLGVAVRIEKFSDSSIDLLVRCFTKSGSWNDWLEVKEKLAIEIKQIVEGNKASFAFPSQSIYIEKK